MPTVGEIKRANTVGLSGENLVQWVACSNCGKLRWKRITSILVPKELQKRIQELEIRVTALEADNALLLAQLNDIANPEPSRRDNSSGVCRDLTGDTQNLGEEKVHSSEKSEGSNA